MITVIVYLHRKIKNFECDSCRLFLSRPMRLRTHTLNQVVEGRILQKEDLLGSQVTSTIRENEYGTAPFSTSTHVIGITILHESQADEVHREGVQLSISPKIILCLV